MSGTAGAKRRTAVLISGRGSNMATLMAASRAADFPAEIVLVVSNERDAPGLTIATKARVATQIVDHRPYRGDRAAHEAAITTMLEAADVEIVCLAGYMRVLTAAFVKRYRGRLVNIHPSLLPAFPGLNTHARALTAGVKLHGATVHLVAEKLDEGPILAQAAVPVLPGDDAEKLAARVLAQEHRIFPLALRLVAEGLRGGGKAPVAMSAEADAALVNPLPFKAPVP